MLRRMIAVWLVPAVGADCVDMFSPDGAIYNVWLDAGTPPQRQQVVADTGSYDLVLASSLCTSTSCEGHDELDVDLSSTYEQQDIEWQITYGSGAVVGRESKDTIALPLAAGTSLSADSIGFLAMESNGFVFYDDFDGLMGMGLSDTTDTGDVALLTSLGVTYFTMCMADIGTRGGRLELNADIDMGSSYVDLQTVGTVSWAAAVEGFSVGGVKLGGACDTANSCSTIIDSGTTLMYVPSTVINLLLNGINNGCSIADCLVTLEDQETCTGAAFDALPEIEISVGGVTAKMSPSAYMGAVDVLIPTEKAAAFTNSSKHNFVHSFKTKYIEGIRCVPLFDYLDEQTNLGSLLILGQPFFRAYSTRFTRQTNQIAIAPVSSFDACEQCPASATKEQKPTAATALLPSDDNAVNSNGVTPQKHAIKLSDMHFPYWAVNPSRRQGYRANGKTKSRWRHAPAGKNVEWMLML